MKIKAIQPDNLAIKKILIRRVDNLGDIVIALPLFRELKKNFPLALITAMVKPNHRPLLYGYADDFILPEPVNKLKLLSDLYDLIFSVEYSVPPDYQPGRINKNSIIHIGTFDWSRKKHIYKHILDGLKAHNLVVSYGQPRIILSSENRKVAREWLKNEKIDNEKFIVAINPGSRLTRSLRSYINLIYLLVMTAVHLI